MVAMTKTVTRVITYIGPEELVDKALEEPIIPMPGRANASFTKNGEAQGTVLIIISESGVTKHDPTKKG